MHSKQVFAGLEFWFPYSSVIPKGREDLAPTLDATPSGWTKNRCSDYELSQTTASRSIWHHQLAVAMGDWEPKPVFHWMSSIHQVSQGRLEPCQLNRLDCPCPPFSASVSLCPASVAQKSNL